MQHELDDGTKLYTEYTDTSGFTIREILKVSNPDMAFQAGYIKLRPMRIPKYDGGRLMKHVDGDEHSYFLIHGWGRTKEAAITHAADDLLRAEIAKSKRN